MNWCDAPTAGADGMYNLQLVHSSEPMGLVHISAFYPVTWFWFVSPVIFSQSLSTPFSPSSYSPEGWKGQKVCGRVGRGDRTACGAGVYLSIVAATDLILNCSEWEGSRVELIIAHILGGDTICIFLYMMQYREYTILWCWKWPVTVFG